jgi:uncharacterized membrane protein YbhN (UPF0104 family)
LTTARRLARTPAARVVFGLVVSALFVTVTLGRVDVGGAARAIGRAAPGWVLIGLALALVEVAIRAWRWQMLLAPFVRVPYRSSAAYLCIGYFANAVLPVRLGDVARSYLAGTAFDVSRLAILGTVLVERLADGIAVLLIALVLGLEVTGGQGLALTAAWVGIAGIAALFVLVGLALPLRRSRLGTLRPIAALRPLLARLALGGRSLHSTAGQLRLVGSTVAPLLVATGTLAAVAASVGISLSPIQAGLAMAAIALSTAIPAAPSSLGTYEFVGLSIFIALGVAPEPALAAVVILHVLATLPVALAGLLLTWHYHVRVGTLVHVEASTTP